jgi:Cdc25 family phosphatase
MADAVTSSAATAAAAQLEVEVQWMSADKMKALLLARAAEIAAATAAGAGAAQQKQSESASLPTVTASSIPARFLVIDVRDDDYGGGHIPGALNYPAHMFESVYLPRLVQRVQDECIQHVIFHCMQSSQRGPACARRFAAAWNRRQARLRAEAATSGASVPSHVPIVSVLERGFRVWMMYARQASQKEHFPLLVEGYEKDYWE